MPQPVTLESLAGLITAGFDTMDGRFDRLEGRVDNLEGGMGGLENRMGGLEGQMHDLGSRMSLQEAAQRATNERLESLTSSNKAIHSDLKEIYSRLTALEKHLPLATPQEYRQIQKQLQALVVWAEEVSQRTGIALPKL